MRGTKQVILLLVMVGTAVLLASGVAIAAVIDGTDNADTLNGTDNPDTINGLGGGDTVSGRDGADKLYGNCGNDDLNGNRGDDEIFGGEDPDIIDGGPGADTIEGNEGGDTVDGGDDTDELSGNRGDDILKGGGGEDIIHGGNDADEIDGGDGDDTLDGEDGADVIVGGAGVDTFNGGQGEDTIRAGTAPAGRDVITCGADDDIVTADSLDEAGTDCEGELRISTRTDTQISGYFEKQGLPRVEFDSQAYPNRGELKGGDPFNRETTSRITVGGTPFSAKVNPNQRNIDLQSYTEEGYQDTLSDEDRRALARVGNELREFLLDGAADVSGLRNEDALVLRHLGYLIQKSSGEAKLTDEAYHYYSARQTPGNVAKMKTNVEAFERHMTVGSDGQLKLDKAGLDQENLNTAQRAQLESALNDANRRIRAGEITAADVFHAPNPSSSQQASAQGGDFTTLSCQGYSGTEEFWWGTRTYYDSCEAANLADDINDWFWPLTLSVVGIPAALLTEREANEITEANFAGEGIVIDEPYDDSSTLTGTESCCNGRSVYGQENLGY